MDREVDIEDPGPWIDDLMENVPEEHRLSMGQIMAFRSYTDCIAHLPERERNRLWAKFNAAMDERFPPMVDPIPQAPEAPKPVVPKPSDEEILDLAVMEFSAPGDQSPEFHEMLFQRAMGTVNRELEGEGVFAKRRRRKRIAKLIRKWMGENLG